MLDINKVRADFPMIKNNPKLIYFDSGATTFKPYQVVEKINDFYYNHTANIHRGDYDISFVVSKEYEDTRTTVKEFINAKQDSEIVFTSGDSASLNLVAYGYALNHLKKGDVVLTTLAEHASNILPWFRVCELTGASIRYIPLNDDGTFNMDNYRASLDENVKIVSLTYVSNVLGYRYPIKDVCKYAHEIGAVVNVDGAQAVPHLKMDVQADDIDFLSFSAHKMCGPSGVGVLYGKMALLEETDPINMGGGANARFDKDGTIILKEVPAKFEAGTPNIEGVLGLKAACEYLMNIGMDEISKHEQELSRYLLDKLAKLDNVIVYNPLSNSSIVAFNVKDIFAQDVAGYLNSQGIAVRSGNHCAKILHNVIGVNETIRASLYLYNTKEEVDRFVEVLKDVTLEKCIGVVI